MGRKDRIPAMLGDVQDEKPDPLVLAIADHFGVKPEELHSFIIVAEYKVEEGVRLNSAWSRALTPWARFGMIGYLKAQSEADQS